MAAHFKDIRSVCCRRLHLPEYWLRAFDDNDGLSRQEISNVLRMASKKTQCYAFRSNHVIFAASHGPRANDYGPDAVWISEADEPQSCNHRRTRPATLAFLVGSLQTIKAIFSVDSGFPTLIQLVGKYVEEDFRIGICVYVTVCFLIQEFP